MIYFESNFLDISYDESINAVIMNWKSFTTFDELKQGLNKGLELLASKKARKWLGNVCKLGALGEDEQRWSNNDWFPRALAAGVKKMAVVVSTDIFNQMTVEEIMVKIPEIDLNSQTFDNFDKAYYWLKAS